jgi:hypothetical protein
MPRLRDHRPSALQLEIPARRARCRGLATGAATPLLGGPERLYVAVREADGLGVVDVVDGADEHVVRLVAPWPEVAVLLLADATGRRPLAETAVAFADEVLAPLPPEGFAITSSEVCAWVLIRAIERSTT